LLRIRNSLELSATLARMQAITCITAPFGLVFQPMVSKDRILGAAASVYAERGFRGATTRRIADVAGVNEVTIFRIFGSKAKLMAEAVRPREDASDGHRLPNVPVDPEAELTAWIAGQLVLLRGRRNLIRRTMSDLEKGPAFSQCAGDGAKWAHADLRRYLASLTTHGFIPADRDLAASPAMLMGAVFSDAMVRELMPEVFPRPSAAPRTYARLFLRAIGLRQRRKRTTAPRRSAPTARTARR
jgi:AcrR family transcriptional regulator